MRRKGLAIIHGRPHNDSMTRIALAAVAMCLLATAAAAQDGLRSASLPERTPMNPVPPPQVDLFRAAPDTYTVRPPLPRHHRRRLGDGYMFGNGFLGPTYLTGYSAYADPRLSRPEPAREQPPVARDIPPRVPYAPAAPPVVAPGAPKTFYVIPGCYAGDRPPAVERLGPGCSISRMRVFNSSPASVGGK